MSPSTRVGVVRREESVPRKGPPRAPCTIKKPRRHRTTMVWSQCLPPDFNRLPDVCLTPISPEMAYSILPKFFSRPVVNIWAYVWPKMCPHYSSIVNSPTYDLTKIEIWDSLQKYCYCGKSEETWKIWGNLDVASGLKVRNIWAHRRLTFQHFVFLLVTFQSSIDYLKTSSGCCATVR